MALSATSIFEIESGGSDSLCAGIFDPAQATNGPIADGITSANTASPVLSCSTYNFVSGDVGAWVYFPASGALIPGWYKIASLSGNSAVLTAGIGTAVLANYSLNTVVGCATTANLTNVAFAIDYSQQNAAQFTITDLISASTTTVSSVLTPFGTQQVGNSIYIPTTANGFTAGRYVISSVSTGTATVIGPNNVSSGTGTASTAYLGGALASPGQAGALMQAGNDMFVQSGTYTVASASSNVSTACITLPADASAANTCRMTGYGTIRGDFGTQPIIKANGTITSFTLLTTAAGSYVENIIFDCNSRSTSNCVISAVSTSLFYRCVFRNATNNGFRGTASNTPAGTCLLCAATGCSGASAFLSANGFGCVAYANTGTGFTQTQTGCTLNDCLSINNTGASSDGFAISQSGNITNCTAYGNGRHGYYITAVVGATTIINSYAEGHSAGYGFSASAASDGILLLACGSNNNASGTYNSSVITPNQVINCIFGTAGGFSTSTTSAFNNPTNGDFGLNGTAGAGALLRSAAVPGIAGSTNGLPGLTTFGTGTGTSVYGDIGAAQHLGLSAILVAPYWASGGVI